MKFSIANLFVLVSTASAFSNNSPKSTARSGTALCASTTPTTLSRSAFTAAAFGAVLGPSAAAFARGIKDANFEGTESKSNAKTCMDRCLYESYKVGNSEEEATKECTKKCKSGKGQLTSFTPGK